MPRTARRCSRARRLQALSSATPARGRKRVKRSTYSDYRQATGVTVGLNQTVIVAYELSANAPTDDGFGWKFLAPGVITSGNSCRVTGV